MKFICPNAQLAPIIGLEPNSSIDIGTALSNKNAHHDYSSGSEEKSLALLVKAPPATRSLLSLVGLVFIHGCLHHLAAASHGGYVQHA